MKYYIDDIVKDVRIALDEIGINDADFLGTDQDTEGADEADLDTIIKSKIIEALRFCILSADSKLVGPGTTIKLDADSAHSYGIDLSLEYNEQSETKVVKAVMPDNFLRLLYAYIKGWPYAVSKVIDATDPQYAELMNPVTTGTEQRPAVGMRKYYESPTTEKMDRFVVELFSTKDNATLNNLQGGISILTEPVTHEEAIPEPVTAPDVIISLQSDFVLSGTVTQKQVSGQQETVIKQYDIRQTSVAQTFAWNKTKGTVRMNLADFLVTAFDASQLPVLNYSVDFGDCTVEAAELSVGYGDGPIISNAPTTLENEQVTFAGDTLTLVSGKASTDAVFYPAMSEGESPVIRGNIRLQFTSTGGYVYDFAIGFDFSESQEEEQETIVAGTFGYSRAAVHTFGNVAALYTPPTIRGYQASGLTTWEAYCAQVRANAEIHISNFVHIKPEEGVTCTFEFTGRVPTKWTDSYYLPDLYDDLTETSHPMYIITKTKPTYATMATALNNDDGSEINVLTANTDLSNITEECYLAIVAVGYNIEDFDGITYECNGEVPPEEGEDDPVPAPTPTPADPDDYEEPTTSGNYLVKRNISVGINGGTSYSDTAYNVPINIEYNDERLTFDFYGFRKTIWNLNATDNVVLEADQQELSFSGATEDSDYIVRVQVSVANQLMQDFFEMNGTAIDFVNGSAYFTCEYNTGRSLGHMEFTATLTLTHTNGDQVQINWNNIR